MAPAYPQDFLASAVVALARQMRPAPECDRVADLALAVMALPVKTHEEEFHRMLMLKAVMGFGPLSRPRGRA